MPVVWAEMVGAVLVGVSVPFSRDQSVRKTAQ